MLKLLCKVGWHRGPWVYVPGRRQYDSVSDSWTKGSCDQTRLCQRCGRQKAPELSTKCKLGIPREFIVWRAVSVKVVANSKPVTSLELNKFGTQVTSPWGKGCTGFSGDGCSGLGA